MSRQEILAQLQVLIAAGLEFGECVAAFADPADDPYVLAAQAQQRDGELEIDSLTVVSRGDDDGAYVMAWLWVGNDELSPFCES